MIARTVLVLAPHTDDAELGCGGTIARMVEEGCHVHVAAFSTAEESLPQGWPPDALKIEFMEAMPVLGVSVENLLVYGFPVRKLSYHRQEVLDTLVTLRNELDPDMVFMPSGHDLHQDHQVVHDEGLRAFRNTSLLGYELSWNHITFSAQAFVILDLRHIERKCAALQCYRSQLQLKRPYLTREFIEGTARVRGIQVKAELAEAFEVMRLKL